MHTHPPNAPEGVGRLVDGGVGGRRPNLRVVALGGQAGPHHRPCVPAGRGTVVGVLLAFNERNTGCPKRYGHISIAYN